MITYIYVGIINNNKKTDAQRLENEEMNAFFNTLLFVGIGVLNLPN